MNFGAGRRLVDVWVKLINNLLALGHRKHIPCIAGGNNYRINSAKFLGPAQITMVTLKAVQY